MKRSGCPAGGRVGFGPTESFKAYMQKPSLFRENGSSLRAATFIQHIPSLILCTYYSFWNPCSRNILKICNERRDFVARPWKDKNSLETKLKKTARGTSLKRSQRWTSAERLVIPDVVAAVQKCPGDSVIPQASMPEGKHTGGRGSSQQVS